MTFVPQYTRLALLVDDDPADQALFARELKMLGIEVFVTSVPEQAMARIVNGDIGCVITDQAMKVTGHELMEAIRSVRADVSLILLSGAEYPKDALPPGVPFVNKNDREAFRLAVQQCMARWKL